jgi:hypothetical protein
MNVTTLEAILTAKFNFSQFVIRNWRKTFEIKANYLHSTLDPEIYIVIYATSVKVKSESEFILGPRTRKKIAISHRL